MRFTRKEKIIFVLYALVILCLLANNYVFAADETTQVINQGTGMNTAFDEKLKGIAEIFIWVAKMLVVILTATAAIMVGLGIEDGKKTLWNWLLGVGLAVNFGWFVVEAGLWEFASQSVKGTDFTFYTPQLKDKAEDIDILSAFMDNYLNGIIIPGSKAILPSCMKLLVILTIIEATWELAFKLVSGDKIKYLLSISIKSGFFLFLMYNWIEYMGALSNGFQELGFTAGGTTLAEGSKLTPDSIWNNAYTLFYNNWYKNVSVWNGFGEFIVSFIGAIIMLIVAVLTAFEMFMARIEFYTMALLTIPLLAFGISSKFSFLTDKAIGAMINLSIKLCVISFLTAMAVPFWKTFTDNATNAKNFVGNIEAIFQAALAALLMFLLIKKIPDLVTGLLSGQPSLGGASMLDTVKNAAKTAAGVAQTVATSGASLAGQVAGASAMSASKGGGVAGTLKNLASGVIANTGLARAYRGGIQKMDAIHRSNRPTRMLRNQMTGGTSQQARKHSKPKPLHGGGGGNTASTEKKVMDMIDPTGVASSVASPNPSFTPTPNPSQSKKFNRYKPRK